MAFIAEIGIAAIAEKIADYTVVAICQQLGYPFQYKRNIGNLITETQDLNHVKKRLQDLVACAIRNGDEIHEDTKEWLKKVDKITEQAEKFLEDENHATIRCSMRGLLFLNLVPRYRQSKRAKKMGKSAFKIKGEVNFDNISYRPHLQSDFTNKNYIQFETRRKIVTEIMEALEDGNVRMVGVHGMPGIGKTTLVKEIAGRALDKKLFNDSVLVSVSHTPDVERIQKAIAERLDLKLDKETIPERALLLQNRLKLEKKFLIILDDIWNELKLEDVGIVFKSDEKGCKILFTSRSRRVLSTEMGVEKIFQVGVLDEAEALNWFNHLVAKSVENNSEFLHLGNEIVNECACLPIAIETIAGTLKDRELPFWKTALRQLQVSNLAAIDDDMNKKVYCPIELCYNSLGSEEKLLLLLCGLHEEDESILLENLMKYGMGWGMFKDFDTLQSARDRVDSLIFKLKDCSLLLDGDYYRTVKMHDVIRDVVVSIASKSHMYSFKNDAEVNRLGIEALEDSMAISLPNGYVPRLLKGKLEYKQLELIWMWRNKSSQIPDNFFENTKKLRVLDLSYYVYFEKLPSSLCYLGNLRTLCFYGHHLEDISLIGGLKNLEILDLSKSGIKELPTEIGQLTLLRMLDLRDCYQLEVIERHVISHLTSLEELYVERSFKKWDEVQGVNGDKRNASLNELKHLDQLTALHLEIVDINVLPKDVFSGKTFERYKIAIGCKWSGQLIDNPSRCLELNLNENGLLTEHGLEMMLESTQMLSLNGFQGAYNIVHELDKAGFPELKCFRLENNQTIQCLINMMEQNHPCSVFDSLEILHLDNLENLEKICDGELTKESLRRLRIIKVSNCDMLKNLLPFSMSKLEEIEIKDCSMIEEIVSKEEDKSKEVIGNFPQLCSLKLKNVPRLKSFCSKLKKIHKSERGKQPVDVDNSVKTLLGEKLLLIPVLEELELSNCNGLTRIWDDQILPSSTSFHNLTKLLVNDFNSLEYLFSSAVAMTFVQLRSLELSDCLNMKEIVSNSEKMDKISFPKLDYLWINNLGCLATFSSEIYIDFPVLTRLFMENCPKFSTFISKSEEEKLPSLFNEKVTFPSLKNLDIRAMNTLKMIANNSHLFCKLEVVDVYNCNNLTKVFTSSMLRALGSLRRLNISRCRMVEQVFEIQTSSLEEITHNTIPARLISLSLYCLPKLRYVWGKDPQGTITFTHLEDVRVLDCPILKSVFPLSIAKGLSKLQKLSLSICGIEQIVEPAGTVPVLPEFVFPQLEEMNLNFMENLVSFYPGLHTSSWPSLKSLVLLNCEKVKVLASELSYFQEKHAHHDHDNSPIPQPLTFTRFDPFPNLEKLELLRCNLEKIWDSKLPPNSHSYRKLKSLHVVSCGFLKNLFSSAEAVNFEQLSALEVKDCMMMEEIMSKNEEVDKVQFTKLNHLNFINLPNLVSFSSETFIEFPLITEISINDKDCPKFKTFVSKLEEEDCTTMKSLFNDKVAFPSLHTVEIKGLVELKMIWQYKLSTADSFSKLEKVIVHNCKNLVKVFSSSMQGKLHNLKRLQISHCEMVEEVFEIQMPNIIEQTYNIMPSQLIHLSLVSLSKLKHVWSKDPQGTLTFPHLKEVTATLCPSLESIFPPSIARELFKLGKLDIQYCGIQEIVAKPQVLEEELETEPPPELLINADSFSELEVKVSHCDNLIRIFPPNMHKVLCNLKKLKIFSCEMVEVVFQIQMSNDEEPQSGIIIPTQLVDLELCYLPNLKHVWSDDPRGALTFPKLERVKAWRCRSLKSMFPASVAKSLFQLQTLNISGCGIEYIISKEVGLEAVPPKFQFHHLEEIKLHNLINFVSFYQGFHTSSFPSLTALMVSKCMKLKVIASDIFNFQETHGSMDMDILYEQHRGLYFSPEMERHVGVLKLEGLPNLMHLMDESSQGQASFQNFITLRVLKCYMLKNLVPSSISLQNLKELTVSQCHGMVNLISSQTAKSMNQLQKMRISDCQRLMEVITSDHCTEDSGEIDFAKLEILELGMLPSLTSFYSGNYKMGFPNLKSIVVGGCFAMQSFSVHGIISTPKLNRLQLDGKTAVEVNNNTDINCIIKHHFKTHPAGTAILEEKDAC
ncbi:uncharacterized protein LOC107435949 isoform X1 [Ziziphus jujuba]|uniref:Uncharacterized protein LOC107435949 isoform X1 n=1 Tax=Ziziphus jujuba TaxID=326968 RepID=A0ABM3IDA2_ZIZJJ|nr:uncharacterized protein LOC107435949 isoform X1 [Ziziphus jujuba]